MLLDDGDDCEFVLVVNGRSKNFIWFQQKSF